MSDQNPVHVLHPEESWGFLRTHEFGRLAFHLVGEVHITPINYAVDGERLIFKTAEGSKLFGVTANTDVAFEVDEIVGERATSVICRGRARTLEGRRPTSSSGFRCGRGSTPRSPSSSPSTVDEISADAAST